MASQVLVGGRVKFVLNGQVIAWGFGVSWSEEMPQEAVDVLDRYEPAEYAVTGYRVTLNARIFRVPGESLRTLGLWPSGGEGPEALRTNILSFAEMDAQVEDSYTGTVVARFHRVKPQSRNVDISPRGIVAKNVSFTAIYHMDEGDVA